VPPNPVDRRLENSSSTGFETRFPRPPHALPLTSACSSQNRMSIARYSSSQRSRGVHGLPDACPAVSVELAEAEVAVGDHRAHAQLIGEDHGLPIGGFSLLDIRRVAMEAISPEPGEPTPGAPVTCWSRANRGLDRRAGSHPHSVGQPIPLTQVDNWKGTGLPIFHRGWTARSFRSKSGQAVGEAPG